MLRKITQSILQAWRTADAAARAKSVDILEHEVGELENIFALLVLGVFVGMPAPPVQITLALMPHLENEFDIMLSKVSTAHDPLGDLFSTLGID